MLLTHGGRRNKEATHDAPNGEADQLGRHDDEPLIGEAPDFVIVGALNSHDIRRVCRAASHIGHDGNQDMSGSHYILSAPIL